MQFPTFLWCGLRTSVNRFFGCSKILHLFLSLLFHFNRNELLLHSVEVTVILLWKRISLNKLLLFSFLRVTTSKQITPQAKIHSLYSHFLYISPISFTMTQPTSNPKSSKSTSKSTKSKLLKEQLDPNAQLCTFTLRLKCSPSSRENDKIYDHRLVFTHPLFDEVKIEAISKWEMESSGAHVYTYKIEKHVDKSFALLLAFKILTIHIEQKSITISDISNFQTKKKKKNA